VRANPHDLGQLGVTTAARVRVRSARGALVLEAIADHGVPRGVACIDFNLHDADPGAEVPDGNDVPGAGASALIDVREPVVDVRLETL